MGHGHGEPYKVPDASIYKIENCPELVEVKEALARRGLKDPWLRNEVWRYDPNTMGTHKQRFTQFMFRGFKFGLGLCIFTIFFEYALATTKQSSGKGHH